jgi:hypothetical protein
MRGRYDGGLLPWGGIADRMSWARRFAAGAGRDDGRWVVRGMRMRLKVRQTTYAMPDL